MTNASTQAAAIAARAAVAGRRLHRTATTMLWVITVAAAAGLVIGFNMVFQGSADWVTHDGAVLAWASLVGWVASLLPSFAAIAVGWHIQARNSGL